MARCGRPTRRAGRPIAISWLAVEEAGGVDLMKVPEIFGATPQAYLSRSSSAAI